MTGASSAAVALELRSVSASYGPFRALFDVSFSVPAGSVVALLGSNGAGKSTVARVASGLVPVDGGRLVVAGRDVTGWPAWRIARAGLAHVPEGRGVFAHLSVEENLVLAVRRRVGRDATAAALGELYERYGVLAQRRGQRAGTLSGGQQRLLSLAKVLAVAPVVAVLDELSLGLAPAVVDDVYRGLEELRRTGTSLVVVEQQVDRALAVADRAVVLERGVVVYDGPAGEAREAVEHALDVRAARRAVTSRVRSVRRYVFDAPVEVVWEGIGRVGEYRSWWPWLAGFDARGLVTGDTWTLEVRPPAPYRLCVQIALRDVLRPERIAADVSGDVVGTASVTLSASAGGGCELVMDSSLAAVRPLVRLACSLVPGLAARSHDALLDAGARQFAQRGLGVRIRVGPHPPDPARRA